MRIRDVMTHEEALALAHPDETMQEAAARMAEADVGMLPVGEDQRLVGVVTDRDIAVRGTAYGRVPRNTTVREVMTPEVQFCFEDEDADDVAARMGALRVRRLAVLNRENWLVGLVSLADIATRHDPDRAGRALQGVCAGAAAGGEE